MGTRNLTLLSEPFAASQNRRLRESRCGGDFSEALTVTVNGTTKTLLAYVWPASGDGDAVDAFAAADVVPPLLQPGKTSRASALRAAMTASRRRVIGVAMIGPEAENRLMMTPG
jgi:hypothetical protein